MCVCKYVSVCVLLCSQFGPLSAAVYVSERGRTSPPSYHVSTRHHPSSSQSASHTAPSLRHLHIGSSLGQSIKLNPCLGWLTNGWWAHIVTELFIWLSSRFVPQQSRRAEVCSCPGGWGELERELERHWEVLLQVTSVLLAYLQNLSSIYFRISL